jgi:hypothetical protein
MNHDKALINYLFNHFSMHASRITIMFEMILSLIKVGNVQQQKLAQGTSVKAKVSSITRRIQRFFAQEFLDQDRVSALIFSMFDWHDKITLTLDRTNWKFGVVDINFLVICGIYKGYSIPLSWTILPHSGNSDTTCRINLLERFLEVVPLNRVGFLLADREFIGSDWFRYLQERGIPFCIRLKENMLVSDTYRGGVIKLKSLFRHVWSGRTREIGIMNPRN